MDFNKIIDVIKEESIKDKLKLSEMDINICFNDYGEFQRINFDIDLNEIDRDKI